MGGGWCQSVSRARHEACIRLLPKFPSSGRDYDVGGAVRARWRVRAKGEINCTKGNVGRYRASQFALMAWRGATRRVIVRTMWRVSPLLVGDSPLSVTDRCLGESVRAWLGTVAMWRVSLHLLGDCRDVASQSALDWGLSRCGESVRT
ncbi:hypothetical protein ACLB2K_029077 [Fragaria x ananassa]